MDVVGGKRMGVERGCESILGGKARSGRRGLVELDWDSPKGCGASSTCTPLGGRSHGGPERELCDLPPAGVRQQQQQQQQWSE